MKAVLHLTKSCNLRCRYCYAPSKIKESMSLDTARKAIDLVLGMAHGSACVAYFGGEPLLCFDAIRELTLYAEQQARPRGTAMHFRLSTNGTLFTDDKLAFCRDHNILYAISLDGDREANDAQRVLPDGSGSWELLDSKLDSILAHNPYTVVTSVITPPTVPRLESSIRYMWSRGLRFVVHQLDYTHPGWTPELFEELEHSYRRLADFYLERVRAGDHFHLSLFDDKLKSHARSPIELGVLCDFGAKKISIAPDGRVFPCVQLVSDRPDAQDYCIGHVDTGLTPRRQELIAENKRERGECQDCALLGRCSNYCGCLNWQMTGQVTRVPPVLCAHERMLIPIADELGNVLWDERNARFLKKHYREQAERFAYDFD
ncbi:MAG: radical SAM protein [Pseudomonadota bacterium]